jgi:hypothetical protein
MRDEVLDCIEDLPDLGSSAVVVEVVGEESFACLICVVGADDPVGEVVGNRDELDDAELLPIDIGAFDRVADEAVDHDLQPADLEGGAGGGVLQHEFTLYLLGSGVVEVVEDEVLLHEFGPSGVLLASSVMTVGDVALLEFLHDGLQQFHRYFLLGLLRVYLVGKFDEAMKILRLTFGHPGAAVDQRSLDHFQFLPRNAH